MKRLSVLCILLFLPCFMFKLKKGPYTTKAIAIMSCNKTMHQFPKEGRFLNFQAELYNTSSKTNLMRGNVNVFKIIRDIQVKTQSFIWKDGTWKKYIALPVYSCGSPLFSFFLTRLSAVFDSTSCTLSKGTYTFTNLDVNSLDHLWASEREYGRLIWKTEASSAHHLLHCLIFETVVGPLKRVK